MRFCEALKITKGVSAIVGGGGKTGLALRLAAELAKEGGAIVCTTTHMLPPAGLPVLVGASGADIAAALRESGAVCVGEKDGQKLIAPNMGMDALARLADYVIVEADGSRGLPLKAHGLNEPAIPEGARIIYVVGADGIGKTVAEAAHRPELYAAGIGADLSHTVTPEDAARMVDCGDTVLFNKADGAAGMLRGRAFAAAFKGRTVIASLRQGKIKAVIDNGREAMRSPQGKTGPAGTHWR